MDGPLAGCWLAFGSGISLCDYVAKQKLERSHKPLHLFHSAQGNSQESSRCRPQTMQAAAARYFGFPGSVFEPPTALELPSHSDGQTTEEGTHQDSQDILCRLPSFSVQVS